MEGVGADRVYQGVGADRLVEGAGGLYRGA